MGGSVSAARRLWVLVFGLKSGGEREAEGTGHGLDACPEKKRVFNQRVGFAARNVTPYIVADVLSRSAHQGVRLAAYFADMGLWSWGRGFPLGDVSCSYLARGERGRANPVACPGC